MAKFIFERLDHVQTGGFRSQNKTLMVSGAE